MRSSLLLRPLSLAFLLGGFLACGGGGGGSTPAPSTPPVMAPTRLTYTSHPSATTSTWRVEVESGNGTGHLVLKVLGPSGTAIKGTAFFLTVTPSQATWGSPGGPDRVLQAGSVLNLTQGPTPGVQLLKGKADAASGALQAGLFQKSGTTTLGQDPVAFVALDLKPTATAGPVNLGSTPGKQAIYLDSANKTQPVTLLVGTVLAQ